MRIKLSVPISAGKLANYLKANISEEFIIYHISTDSREICDGDLFIPLRGEHFDGSNFISEAISRGARIMYSGYDIDVSDPNSAILKLAEYYKALLEKLRITVAVTGSVGKTTTKEFITTLLAGSFNAHTNKGNMNNEIGVPLTVLSAPADTEILVLECGTNHKGELSRISRSIKPDIAVITNIGTAHIGNFGSRMDIANAKCEICEGISDGVLLCNINEPLLIDAPYRKTVSIGKAADFTAYSLAHHKDGYIIDFATSESRIKGIYFPIDAEHLIINFIFALTVAVLCGVGEKMLRKSAAKISAECLRYKYIECGSFTLLDDSYNASLESVKAALNMLRAKAPPTAALLGDVLELGDYTEEIHREIGRYASKCGLSKLYLTGEFTRFIAAGAIDGGIPPSSIFIAEDASPAEMAKIIECAHDPGELILVKASHRSNLTRVINILKEGKGYD